MPNATIQRLDLAHHHCPVDDKIATGFHTLHPDEYALCLGCEESLEDFRTYVVYADTLEAARPLNLKALTAVEHHPDGTGECTCGDPYCTIHPCDNCGEPWDGKTGTCPDCVPPIRYEVYAMNFHCHLTSSYPLSAHTNFPDAEQSAVNTPHVRAIVKRIYNTTDGTQTSEWNYGHGWHLSLAGAWNATHHPRRSKP